MTTSRASLVGFLTATVIAFGASVSTAADARCTDGRWTIDGGPLTIGPLSIGTVALREGVPVLDAPCRAVRWALGRVEGETRLRALFVCRLPSATRRSHRVALRLRAHIVDECTRMEGAFAVRRFGEIVRFTATLGADGCASNADCAAEQYCAAPAGDCTARGTCEPRPQACPDNVAPVCGCDGKTYSNACDAAAAGVRVAHEGECRPVCGGIAGIPCPAGEFCDLPAGECSVLDLQGRCVLLPETCPKLFAPVCGCDGETYGNDCERLQAGVQKAHDGECGECASNAQCDEAAYCAKPSGHCDARAQCEPRPQGCPDNVEPVCGCDRTTYFNACEAAAAGVSLAYEGECREVCGGIAGIACPEGEFCELPAGACGSADLEGRCVEVTDACPEFYAPVCGCDGVTYANECFRQAAHAQEAHDGPCECVPKSAPCETTCDCYAALGTGFCNDCPLACPDCGDYWECQDGTCAELCGVIPPEAQACIDAGCTTNAQCGDDTYCAKPSGECAANGKCEARPLVCPDVYLPVCGCDGHTYGNRCEAAAAGVSAAHEGECGGCTSLLDCPPNEFCQAPIGVCGGPGDCTFIEQVCPGEYDPVCGCDGETYTNRCHAAMRAVSIAHTGTCEGVCGGIAGIPCPDGQFCDLPAGECHSADLQGRCVAIGGACPQIYDPVCSCDGKTYPNDCERQQAGAQKSHDGACECVPVCCTLGSEPFDIDGDGCGDACVGTACGGGPSCPTYCETSCDCYGKFGDAFCDDCPLLCPNCGSYWQCKDNFCVEQCGQLPPDVTTCFVDPAR